MLSENGLELKSIKTKYISIVEVKDLARAVEEHFNSDGFVVAYQTNKILIGRYVSQNFKFYNADRIDERFLLKARIFNSMKELLLWRANGVIKGRLRIDTEGDESYVVDAYQQLWGTDQKRIDSDFTKIFEERGTELILPFSSLEVDNKKNRVFIKVRNYIEYHKGTCLSTYGDCRFVGFYDRTKKEIT